MFKCTIKDKDNDGEHAHHADNDTGSMGMGEVEEHGCMYSKNKYTNIIYTPAAHVPPPPEHPPAPQAALEACKKRRH